MNIVGIIPARFASTRLMGKLLADIGGKPVIQHTYESLLKSKLMNDVIIAVDDEKLYEVVRGFGAKVQLTPKELLTSTDRVAYIAEKMSADVFLNIPGAQPFISARMIDEVIEPHLFDPEISITTLAKKIDSVDEMKSTSIPKVVFDYNNYALYFSYSPIPFVKDARTNIEKIISAEIYKHIEVYAYSNEIIKTIGKLKPTDLERIEKLEQLRLLEHGLKIKMVVTEEECLSINTPSDLELSRRYFNNKQKRR
ncbi:MAG: 3-deoxy-manno-octulosonate cytidylyltransferase [Melioribacteraceae bacterium]|jgi:3-deoxy-manno-octulosonate cytidylyltransferase (CMP-KDO synthetase)|nr:3-deoxy-manno-octulosonate cytidylyltransferase [Melioribacteraceae bacterium]